jgi:hypothetical protein
MVNATSRSIYPRGRDCMVLGVGLERYGKSRRPSLVRTPARSARSLIGKPTRPYWPPFASVLKGFQSSENRCVYTFIVFRSRVVHVLDYPEDGGNKTLRSIRNYIPI